jgi:hypothetical protein
VVVLLAVFATPHGSKLTASVPLTPGSPRILEVEADTANVSIVLIDAPTSQLAIEGELLGFGLPASRLVARTEVVSQPLPRLRYRIETQGWLTDVDGVATLRVPATAFERVIADVQRGNIRVSDTTRARAWSEKSGCNSNCTSAADTCRFPLQIMHQHELEHAGIASGLISEGIWRVAFRPWIDSQRDQRITARMGPFFLHLRSNDSPLP